MAHARRGVYDVGALGVRCLLGRANRCTNGPAAGKTLAELQDPVVNIQVGAAIMEAKRARHGRHYLRHYNGGTREHGYAERIGALAAAFRGTFHWTKWARTREQCRRIVTAVAEERKS